MKQLNLLIGALAAACILATPVQAKLKVVATLPDYGALAKEIGGNAVEVTILAKPTEDAHFVDPRPSFVVNLQAADVLIEGGAELEMGWLPALLRNVGNPKIAAGAPGRVIASQGIRLVNVPVALNRAAGDIHSLGNPHFMLDPIIAKVVARHISQAFSAVDSAGATAYASNYQAFEQAINAKLQEWGKAMLPFRGRSVAAYHDSWPYFAHRFGISIDVFLEPKPGIPPSPAYLAEVISKVKSKSVKAILVEPYQNRKVAEKVAAAGGAKVVEVAQFPGALPGTGSYIALLDVVVSRLAAALGGS